MSICRADQLIGLPRTIFTACGKYVQTLNHRYHTWRRGVEEGEGRQRGVCGTRERLKAAGGTPEAARAAGGRGKTAAAVAQQSSGGAGGGRRSEGLVCKFRKVQGLD